MTTLQFIRQLSESRSLLFVLSAFQTEPGKLSTRYCTRLGNEYVPWEKAATCFLKSLPKQGPLGDRESRAAESGSKAYTAGAALFSYLWASYLPGPCLPTQTDQTTKASAGVVSVATDAWAAGQGMCITQRLTPCSDHVARTEQKETTWVSQLALPQASWHEEPHCSTRRALHITCCSGSPFPLVPFKQLLGSGSPSQVGSAVSSRDSCWNQDYLQMDDPLN